MLGIPQTVFRILPATNMAERETMGQRLGRARKELGLSLAELREKIKKELRADIGTTTIREIEADRPPNPGVKTIELLARGVEIPPLEVLALALDEELQDAAVKTERDFTKTRLMRLWRLYGAATPRERTMIDDLVQMLIDRVGKKTD